MAHFRFSGVATAFCIGLLFFTLPFSAGQSISETPVIESDAETGSIAPLRISLNVSEVRLDVVVVDNRGRPITDLTAADFEIYQNKMPQKVTSGIYIENQADTVARPAASRKDTPNLTRFPTTMLKEEDVRRTIVFIVDNLSMAFEHLHYARTSIKGFLEKQMQPGDIVAVIRTGSGNSAINFFSSDKSQIYRDGKEFLRSEPSPVTQKNAENSDGIALLRGLIIGQDMPPGDYLLQLLVTDKKNSRKRDNEGVAVQKDGGGLLSRIIRAYINAPKGYSGNTDKGVASQTLSFTVAEP